MSTSHYDTKSFLAGLAALAARDFASIQTAIDAILQLMVEQFHMRSSFLAQVTAHNSRLEVLAAYNTEGGCNIQVGTSVPLSKNFTESLAKMQKQPPLLVGKLKQPDDPQRQQGAGPSSPIGCYIGVPLILSDNTVFGVLAAADPEPQSIKLQQTEVLVVLARHLINEIERHYERDKLKMVHTELTQALKTVNKQLEQMNRMRTNFIATISHEFRTALTGIQGFSEVMRDEEFTLQEMKEFAANIHMDAERLTRVIADLLDLERMESGLATLSYEKVDLKEIIRGIVEGMGQATPNHTFRYEFDEELPEVEGDPDKLVQVFTNLLTNAVKYAPKGEIVLRGYREGLFVHMQVQDRGIGIAPDRLEQVFEKHSGLETSTGQYIKGMGLGLPIVRQIVQMHGGKVWAESDYGQGATFHVLLPIACVETTANIGSGCR